MEHVEKVNFYCFQKETWLMKLVLRRVQKERYLFEETCIIIVILYLPCILSPLEEFISTPTYAHNHIVLYDYGI
jgi:hypothetical protein